MLRNYLEIFFNFPFCFKIFSFLNRISFRFYLLPRKLSATYWAKAVKVSAKPSGVLLKPSGLFTFPIPIQIVPQFERMPDVCPINDAVPKLHLLLSAKLLHSFMAKNRFWKSVIYSYNEFFGMIDSRNIPWWSKRVKINLKYIEVDLGKDKPEVYWNFKYNRLRVQ